MHPSGGQESSNFKVMMTACHCVPYVQPREPLPSRGGQPEGPSAGCSPKAAPITPCLCSLSRRGHLTQSTRTRVPSPNNDRGEGDTERGFGGCNGGRSYPILWEGRGVLGGRGKILNSCRVSASHRKGAETTAQLEGQTVPKGTSTHGVPRRSAEGSCPRFCSRQ